MGSTDGAPAGDGWDAPGVADHTERPNRAGLQLTDERRGHILDGEDDGKAGGHRHGTGRPGKTEFPERWDDETTAAHVLSVARNPDRAVYQPNGRWRLTGTRDDVSIVVILETDGSVCTAWPPPGGRGVTVNPSKGGTS